MPKGYTFLTSEETDALMEAQLAAMVELDQGFTITAWGFIEGGRIHLED